MIELNTVYNENCLIGMSRIADKSVDMILCDLPYGTTACKWDTIIPFAPLWEHYERVIKDNGAIVLTAAQPFASALVMSNTSLFKYEWIWDKVNKFSGHLNAKMQPLRIIEGIYVFYKTLPTYNPQMVSGKPYVSKSKGRKSENYGAQADEVVTVNNGNYYPKNLLSIAGDERGSVGRIHPTQKPVALFEYLIRTYTNEGDTVLDNCMGSFTTAVAAINSNRKYIGFEMDENYFKIGSERVQKHLKTNEYDLFKAS